MRKHLSKILITAFIATIFLGFFGITQHTYAQRQDSISGATQMFCYKSTDGGETETLDPSKKSREECEDSSELPDIIYRWGGVNGAGQAVNSTGQEFDTSTETNYKLGCSLWDGMDGVIGCIAGTFYIFWEVSAWVAKLGGYFLDFFVYYSTNSSSYDNAFVSKGWGAVRDIANIFFIISLLYVAIKMVLSLDDHGNKKLIGSVIIVALVINFSLFTTKVIIDSTNILAKIFYNSITVENKDGGATTGSKGEKSISVGLIKHYNPQQIVTRSNYDKTGDEEGKVGPGKFIFITILLLFITLYTAYIFFSVALLFVARVVSLWIAMIFSPIAFISYSLPFDIPFGHKEWWSEFLKNAFLAPIYIFFLYIIVMFLEVLPEAARENTEFGSDWMQSMMGVVIPFAILMMLLKKSKGLAEKYSGEMGKATISAAKMLGGMAVGGAALGAGTLAFAGRNLAGRTAASLSKREGAVDYGKARSKWEIEGRKGKWEDYLAKYQADNKVKIPTDWKTKLGGQINASQLRSGETDHARHEMDELKKKLGLEGIAAGRISGVEQEKMESTFVKDHRSEIEGEIRRGYDSKGKILMIDKDGNPTTDEEKSISESKYKAGRREALIREIAQDPNNINDFDETTGELNDQGKKKVEDRLNTEFNNILQNVAQTIGKTRFEKLKHEEEKNIGMGTRVMSRSTSGTYDVRNIASLASDRREGIGTKAAIGIIAAVATGMRMGMKKVTGVDAGTAKGNFATDMKEIINESLKNLKVDVKLSGDKGHDTSHGVAAHAPSDDHGGGHH